jgi:hypothetical protein
MREHMLPWLQGGNAGGFHNNRMSWRCVRALALRSSKLLDLRVARCGTAVGQGNQPVRLEMWRRGKGKNKTRKIQMNWKEMGGGGNLYEYIPGCRHIKTEVSDQQMSTKASNTRARCDY